MYAVMNLVLQRYFEFDQVRYIFMNGYIFAIHFQLLTITEISKAAPLRTCSVSRRCIVTGDSNLGHCVSVVHQGYLVLISCGAT